MWANGLTAAVQCGELARPQGKVLSSASGIKAYSGETASVFTQTILGSDLDGTTTALSENCGYLQLFQANASMKSLNTPHRFCCSSH